VDSSFLFGPWFMFVPSAGAGACGLWSRAAHISSWGTLSTEVDGPEAPVAPPEGAIILASSGSKIVKTIAITSPPPHHPSLLKRKWRDESVGAHSGDSTGDRKGRLQCVDGRLHAMLVCLMIVNMLNRYRSCSNAFLSRWFLTPFLLQGSFLSVRTE